MVGGNPGAADLSWWTPGLTLAERLAAHPLPTATASDDTERARVRLARWRSAQHRLAERLASVGADEGDLLSLLREPRGALAARTVKPLWAREVERVVDLSGAPGPAGFGAVVAPFVEDARRRLATEVDQVELLDGFAETVRRGLVWTTTRTLVLELNVARMTGRLDGVSPEDRFAAFVRHAASRAGLTDLLAEYPVLARLLWQATDAAVVAFAELVRRFADDRADIVRTLLGGREPGPLARITTGAGDLHGRGRSVAVLRFTDGTRVVYKPRPMSVHRHFNQVVEWLNSVLPGPGQRTLAVLDRGDWGWVEFAEHRPVADVREVERFYHRQGVLLALLHLLDGTDQHFENLVACGDQPVLVDVETLFHPTLGYPALATDPAARALESSVLRTALLPQLMTGTNGVFDLSGVGGDKGVPLPDDVVGFDATGTDRMRVVRTPGLSTGADNRPRLAGVDVDPGDHVERLVAGFRAAYDALHAHRAEFVGLLDSFADDVVRVVVRATDDYTRLLDESTHPDALRDALDRDRVFDHLWTLSGSDQTRRSLISHELTDLWAGDVPLFTTTPASHDLVACDGTRVPGALGESGLTKVLRKVDGMGPADRRLQEWIIRTSFEVRGAASGHAVGAPAPAGTITEPDTQRLVAAARRIGDDLLARAHTHDGRVNWVGFEHVDDQSWAILPLGASLSSGYPGVALFLGQLAQVTGEDRYADVARRSVGAVPWLLDRLGSSEAKVPVGFAGLGGLAYALAHLAASVGDPELVGWVEAVIAVATTRIEGDDVLDYLGGSAGCLAAMLTVHRLTRLDSAWRAATAAAERLALADESRGPGFAHGDTGIDWVRWRFATAAGRPHAFADQPSATGQAWCTGASGVGLALADVLGRQQDRRLSDALDRTVDDVLGHPLAADHGLCHGDLGTLELISAAAEAGHPAATAERRRRLGGLLSAVDRHGPVCGTPGGVSTPGLLTGLAGVGHGLLRAAFADRVPSVLLLD